MGKNCLHFRGSGPRIVERRRPRCGSINERFEVLLGGREQKTTASFPFQAKRSHIVGREDYQASVQQSLVKIGARLRNPSFQTK